MNATKIKALALIKENKKIAEQKHGEFLEWLKKDPIIEEKLRRQNALKWDYVVSYNNVERSIIESKLNELDREIEEYFVEHSLDIKYLYPVYSCEKCEDTGVYQGKECECVERMVALLTLEENPTLKNCSKSLKNIDFDFYKDEAEQKIKYVKCIYKALNEGSKAYYLLTGATGTAKTYVATVALNEMLNKGYGVKVMSAIKLNKAFLEYHCAPLEKKDMLWQRIIGYDCMLVDDLGVEQVFNNVTIPYLYEFLVERMEKVTFFTTNLDLIDLEKKYGQRILSRLLDKRLSLAIEFKGKDLRFN